MKKIFVFFISILSVIAFSVAPVRTAHAQLTVTQGAALSMTPVQLVQQILVGTGITVSNATLNGSAATITANYVGSFTTAGTATTQLGFTGGIILASGNATNAIGPKPDKPEPKRKSL
ncbi:MAG TPA: choice-of-anchor L domain-containing protein [Bacteroidales bacterium]|nr:choice-of-anchor L domain-containing protein [Bacteroidales bacterium]